MYSYNELNAVTLSPTKKDYYQIWNELIDVAGKISERWNPAATNESDPGIVLLKVLTAVADKLNYNIDANSLESFMPSAAQEASMRKLCDMLGYAMRYFISATTTVRISYKGDVFPTSATSLGGIYIDRFTNIKDVEGAHNFITLEPVTLSREAPYAEVTCLEGEIIDCETNQGKTISIDQLDDNNRYFLPEQQVAANGIFISNVDSKDDSLWTAVENLNTQLLGSKVFKFGYDANMGLPFVQFPEDISTLIKAGLSIRFVRTKGLSGNVSIGTLSTMEKPLSWSKTIAVEDDAVQVGDLIEEEEGTATTEESMDWANVELYSVRNITAAVNGKNPETIDEAYWNYQKTIGTFETLVTCRDYMNKIYAMTVSAADTTPLVSNIIVSDIRDDINCACQIRKMTAAGAEYNSRSLKIGQSAEDRITHFDLVLYPFCYKAVFNTPESYKNTFNYLSPNLDPNALSKLETIKSKLANYKTIAHQFQKPIEGDIVNIKVYFNLSARITATSKITALEAADIEAAAHKALYKQFNLRHLTFGEELPFDLIQTALETSDVRIKNVNLDDPKLWVAVQTVDGNEYPLFDVDYTYKDKATAETAKNYYTKLIVRNILAGKIPLYDYNTSFKAAFEDVVYKVGSSDYYKYLTNLLMHWSMPAKAKTLKGASDVSGKVPINVFGGTDPILVYKTTGEGDDMTGSWELNPDPAQILLFPGESFTCSLDTLIPPVEGDDTRLVTALNISVIDQKTNVTDEFRVSYNSDKGVLGLTGEAKTKIVVELTNNIISISTPDSFQFPFSVSFSLGPTDFVSTAEQNTEFSFEISSDKVALDLASVAEAVGDLPTFWDTTSSHRVLKGITDFEDNDLTLDFELEERSAATTTPNISKIKGMLLVDTSGIKDESKNETENATRGELTLKANEVLQFRTKNLKTTATYPAYVNYYAHLDTTAGEGTASDGARYKAAVPATMYTLREFLNGGEAGYDEQTIRGEDGKDTIKLNSNWNRFISSEEKFGSMPEDLANSFYELGFVTTGNSGSSSGSGSAAEQTDNAKLKNLLKTHKEVFIKHKVDGKDAGYILFAATVGKGESEKTIFFSFEDNTLKVKESLGENGEVGEIEAGQEIYIRSFKEVNFVKFVSWLQGNLSANMPLLRYDCREESSAILTVPDKVPMVTSQKLIKGVYSRRTQAMNRKAGYLIDANLQKYELRNTINLSHNLDSLYVPRLWKTETSEHTTDGVGRNAVQVGIPANTTYQLGKNEFILITYSTSEGRADDTNVVKNIKLAAGSIIKTNFELVDSNTLSATKGYTKTSNYGPWRDLDTGEVISASSIGGMYTLGPTEQIEVKEPVQVALDTADTLLYWEVNTPIIESGTGYEVFPFNENGSYILKSGEYLFYTDSNKEGLAYYGAGTEICKHSNTPVLRKASTGNLSMDQMIESGIVDSIPWTAFNLAGNDRQLDIIEYQIINLVEGDTLKALTLSDKGSTLLTDNYRTVSAAKYTVLGQEADLPAINVEGFEWQIRTMLNIRSSADKPQILSTQVLELKNPADNTKSIKKLISRDLIYLEQPSTFNQDTQKLQKNIYQIFTPEPALDNTEATLDKWEVKFDDLAIATSSPIIDAGEGFSLDTGSSLVATSDTLKIKACKKEPVKQSGSADNIFTTTSTMSGFTPIRMGATHTDESIPVLKFHILVPADHLAKVSILYTPSSTLTAGVYVRATTTVDEEKTLRLARPILSGTGEAKTRNTWWSSADSGKLNPNSFGKLENEKYYLRSGLNQIVVDSNSIFEIYAPAQCTDGLLLDSIRLVHKAKTEASVNSNTEPFVNLALSSLLDLKLSAEATSHTNSDPNTYFRYLEGTDEKYLYITPADIEQALMEYDPYLELFPIADDNEITLELIEGDTVLSPRSLFDKENANNKFVVSALNTDYLSKFIGVSRFSITRGEGL